MGRRLQDLASPMAADGDLSWEPLVLHLPPPLA